MKAAIDEETRHSANAAGPAAALMLPYLAQVCVLAHFIEVTREIQLQALCIALQLPFLELELIVEQQLVHLPKFSLRTGALGRFCSSSRVRMHFFKREVTEHVPDAAPPEACQEGLHRHGGLLAVRTLKVCILDKRNGRVRAAQRVISDAHGGSQVEGAMMSHEKILDLVQASRQRRGNCRQDSRAGPDRSRSTTTCRRSHQKCGAISIARWYRSTPFNVGLFHLEHPRNS